MLSDFISEKDFSKELSIAGNRHDLIAIQVFDKRDSQLPDVGFMRVVDLETGNDRWIDTSSKSVRNSYGKWWYDCQQKNQAALNRYRIDYASVPTDEDYVKVLMGLFKRRGVK